MSTVTVPINVQTCKLGSFWQTEILAGKAANQPQCCGLFTSLPAELPEFCAPTATWCEYQAKGGPSWSKVKPLCCKSFGPSLTSYCQTT